MYDLLLLIKMKIPGVHGFRMAQRQQHTILLKCAENKQEKLIIISNFVRRQCALR